MAQLVGKESCLQCRRPQFDSWVGKICWRRDRLPTPVFLDFPCGSAGKEAACNAGDLGLIPGLGRFPSRRERLPTPVFCLEEFHGLYSPWSHKESDTTEWLSLSDSFWLLWIMLLWIFSYTYLYRYIFSFLLGWFPRVELIIFWVESSWLTLVFP